MEYFSIQDFSEKWNVSKRRIQILCKEGRINGAKMIGNMWVIPKDASRPADARTKNPTVNPVSTGDSIIRRELKKLLRSMYKTAETLSNDERNKKDLYCLLLQLDYADFI
ncbi:helix-turn-helix domain-containing protein [Lachnospiraceae bacterium 29-91]